MNLDVDEDMIKLNLDQERQAYQARLQEEQEEREPGTTGPEKMSLLLFLPLLFLCVVGDLIDIFTAGTIGWGIGLFIDAVLLISTGLSKSGRKQFKRILIGAVADSFPFVAFLPFRSIFLVWAFIKSRSEAAQHLAEMGEKIKNRKNRNDIKQIVA